VARAIDDFEARARLHPDDPDIHSTLAAHCWNLAYRGFRLTDAEKNKYIEDGVAAADRALALRADHPETLVYKSLLRRLQGHLERNQAQKQLFLDEADRLRALAEALRRQRSAESSS
jgi:hypothetical protein